MIENFTNQLNAKTKKMGVRTAAFMADLLSISEDAAYRRIRNPQALRADEMIKIARELDIDLSQFSNTNSNMLTVEVKPLHFETYTSRDFFKELEARIDHCIFHPHSQITYGAKEIPFFYYMWFPQLAAFKQFIWQREFLRDPAFNKSQFEGTNEVESQYVRLAEKYLKVTSHEIWGYETLYSTLYQIQHYHESGLFKDEKVYQSVLQQYDMLIDLIFEQAEHGRKLNPYLPNYRGARFKLFFTPMITVDNSIIFHSIKEKIAMICSPMSGVVVSDNPHWVYSTDSWLETSKENGILLSKTGNLQRQKLRKEYDNKKATLGM